MQKLWKTKSHNRNQVKLSDTTKCEPFAKENIFFLKKNAAG